MAKPFKTLADKMSPESLARAAKLKERLLRELSLRELRSALDLTQQKLAEKLGVKQAAISKIESQSDMYISTLRRCLAAMGYKLKIVATSDEGEVTITQFKDIPPLARKRTASS